MSPRLPRMVAVVLALLPSAVRAQSPIPDDVQQSVRARIAAGTFVSAVIGIVDSSGTRYFAAGNTALAGGRPADEHTVYEIGSITKVFTALALADMVRAGEVGLDDPVERYLPAGSVVPARNGKSITLRLLSSQRSGLPRMPDNFSPADQANPYADYGSDRLLAFLRGYTLTRDPGERYEYSNLGVGLLGFALAQRARTSYEQLVTARVITPLGMRETMITLTPAARTRLAMGHAGGHQVSNWDLDALAGAGAVRSTAADMTRFLAAAMGLTHTRLDSAFAMTVVPQGDAGSPVMDIGLGWHILKRPALRIVWHNGGTGGYRTWAGYDPARKVGVVVLTNAQGGPDDIGFHLLDPTRPLVVVRSAIPMSRDSLDQYVGRYPLAPDFVLTVTRSDDSLIVQATNQPTFRLLPSAPNEFFLRTIDAQITFVRDSSGRVASLVLHQNGGHQPARREQ